MITFIHLMMSSDFRHACQVETRKIVWLLALVLASVLIIQFFELPYRDSMLSFLSFGNPYFNISDANIQDLAAFTPINSPIPQRVDSPSLENTTDMNHSSELEETAIVRSISIAPQNAITSTSTTPYVAPSPALVDANITPSSIVINDSDSLILGPTSSDASFASKLSPMAAPRMVAFSPLGSANRNETRSNEKSKSVNPPSKEAIVSISEMSDLLLQSRASSAFSKVPLV